MSIESAKPGLYSFIRTNCLKTGDEFELSSGQRSNLYFDCKPAMLSGEQINTISRLILEESFSFPDTPNIVGGLAIGANLLVSGIIVESFKVGGPIREGTIVYKDNGVMKIFNEPREPSKILIVDDVTTTESSLLESARFLKGLGHKIVGAVVIVDRRDQTTESKFEKEFGFPVKSLFKLEDFL